MKKIFTAFALSAVAFSASALEPLGYPGSSWSVLTYNPGVIENTRERGNVLLQGKIEQGIDWTKFGGWTLNTYASVAYSLDKNKIDYNNKLVPAVGVKMSRKFDSGVFDVGVQAVHERRIRVDGPNKTGNGVQVYASYWFGWNLK